MRRPPAPVSIGAANGRSEQAGHRPYSLVSLTATGLSWFLVVVVIVSGGHSRSFYAGALVLIALTAFGSPLIALVAVLWERPVHRAAVAMAASLALPALILWLIGRLEPGAFS